MMPQAFVVLGDSPELMVGTATYGRHRPPIPQPAPGNPFPAPPWPGPRECNTTLNPDCADGGVR